MPDPLSLIPSGSQYDTLRWTLRHLKALDDAGYGTNYAGLANQADRIRGWVAEIDSGTGRDADQIRDDIVRHIIGPELAREAYGIVDPREFDRLVAGGNEGGINLGDVSIIPRPSADPKPTPKPPAPKKPKTPKKPTPKPPAPKKPKTPKKPTPKPQPKPEPINWRQRVRTLYPWLPDELVGIFADRWAETGDPQLALAHVRADRRYEKFFPGIKREDGSLRMSEQEWFATRDAYGRLVREYQLNPGFFEPMFTSWMEGEVSPSEAANRLAAAYEQIVTNIPQVRQFYADQHGIELSDQAVFASFLDPEISDGLLNRRISVAQIGGEASARGFDIAGAFAERLSSAGVDQSRARSFFSQAEDRLPTLDELARRFRDPDSTFDVEELAEAAVFGSAGQSRRIRRLLAAEQSLFSDQIGSVATSESLAVTGLSAR